MLGTFGGADKMTPNPNMKLPIRFPKQAEAAYEAAQAFRRLSVLERLREIGRFTRACQALAQSMRRPDVSARLRDERHERLRQHLQAMARRYGTE